MNGATSARHPLFHRIATHSHITHHTCCSDGTGTSADAGTDAEKLGTGADFGPGTDIGTATDEELHTSIFTPAARNVPPFTVFLGCDVRWETHVKTMSIAGCSVCDVTHDHTTAKAMKRPIFDRTEKVHSERAMAAPSVVAPLARRGEPIRTRASSAARAGLSATRHACAKATAMCST